MSSFSQFERDQFMAIKRKEDQDMDCIKCTKCKGQWFEQVKCSRYRSDHSVVLGQAIPTRPGSIDYILLRCVLCGNPHEPRVLHATRDLAGGDYNNFLDTMEGKNDSRKEDKKKEESKAKDV